MDQRADEVSRRGPHDIGAWLFNEKVFSTFADRIVILPIVGGEKTTLIRLPLFVHAVDYLEGLLCVWGC